MQKIIYWQLAPADHSEYSRVRLDSLKKCPDNFGSTYEEELSLKSLKLTDAIQRADKYNFAYGAFTEEQKLIGICGFITDRRLKTRHRGEIVQLFVGPEYHGQGIGKKLLQLIVDKAFDNAQTELILLAVVSTNESAVNLYKQSGFREYGKLEKYFKSGTGYAAQSFFYLTK